MSDPVVVDCPCCGAKLVVDGSTGDVLSFDSKHTSLKNFDEALGEVQSGGRKREDAFSKAFDRTKRLGDVLDKKFEEAKRKAAEDKSPRRNPFDAD